MFTHWFNSVIPAIEQLGPLGYLVIFLLFFTEALVGIGLIVPGAIIAFLLGTLVSQGVFDLRNLLIFGSLGFALGDALSFALGRKGTGFFRKDARFLKLSHLEKGIAFFDNHGSKSVFIGRFIGPLRPLTPFIAGLAKMRWLRFLVLNTLSIVSWLAIHVLAGFFFGQTLWILKLWSSRLQVLAIYIALAAAVVWLSKQLIIKNGRTLLLISGAIWSSFKQAVAANQELLAFRQRHAASFDFLEARLTTKGFFGRQLTGLTILFALTVVNFSLLTDSLFTIGQLSLIDQRIENLMHTFKNFVFMKFFVGLTVLGSWQVIAMLMAGISVWLYLSGRGRLNPVLWLTTAGSSATAIAIKYLVDRPRQSGGLYLETSPSFPSLHATLAIAFFGFVWFVYNLSPCTFKRKINAFFAAAALVFLIGVSRLYLRVHYLSDVMAGYLIGFAWLLIGIGLMQWRQLDKIVAAKKKAWTPALKMAIVILLLMEISAYAAFVGYYRSKLNLVELEPLPPVVSHNILEDFERFKLSKYTESFDGDQQEPISFIVAASSSESIVNAMAVIGYEIADKPNFHAFVKALKKGLVDEPYGELPISPSFWNTEVNDLAFTRRGEGERHYIKFWQTSFMTPNGKPIFLGIAGAKRPSKLIITKTINPNIDGERDHVFAALNQKKQVASWSRHQFISPQIVKKLLGEYFTDGKLYIVDLRR